MRLLLWTVAAAVASLLTEDVADAGNHGGCAPCCPPTPCVMQTVSKVVLVPQVSFKTITVPVLVCHPQVRAKQVTVCKLVPETRVVSRICTVMVPEQRMRIETVVDCEMTYEDIARDVQVMVPHLETRQGVRTACKPVMVQEMQTVCQDEGQYEDRQVVDHCGCARVCRVWQPKLVNRQVPVMVCKQEISQVPCSYQVMVCKPEMRRVVERVCKPVYTSRNVQVNYMVCVAKQVEKQFQETICREVTEQRVVNCTVMVPTIVQREVTVPVCKMVPKTVTCSVMVPCTAVAAPQSPTQAPNKE